MSLEEAYAASMVEVEDGQIVEGTVVKVDRDEVLLDIGYKSEGVIPARELSIRNDVDPSEIVGLGDKIEALVLQKEDKEGRLVLSKKRAQYERAWGTIEKIKEEDGVVRGPVIEVVKGGLILDIGLRGFLPASLVELRRVRDLAPYVGRSLEAKIIELDKNRNNVVLSRRAWLEETAEGTARGLPRQPEAGRGPVRVSCRASSTSVRSSTSAAWTASSTCPSCRGSTSTTRARSCRSATRSRVQVLDVDLDRERISLSLKATQQDPWQEFATTHRVGELVYGRVTKLVPFGAFVQVGDGIEGLVHISEMSAHHVDLPEQVVTPGEELWVKIIDLDLPAGASACRSSRPPRAARSRRSTASTSASTPTTSRATTSATTPPSTSRRGRSTRSPRGSRVATRRTLQAETWNRRRPPRRRSQRPRPTGAATLHVPNGAVAHTPSLRALVGGVVAFIGLLIGLGPLDDNSYLTHLATGRIIWDTHHIPHHDPYSFTAFGHPWVVQSWLASVIYGAADKWWGPPGVLLVVAVGGHGRRGARLDAHSPGALSGQPAADRRPAARHRRRRRLGRAAAAVRPARAVPACSWPPRAASILAGCCPPCGCG